MKRVVQDMLSLSGPSYFVVTIGPMRSLDITTLLNLLIEGKNETTRETIVFCVTFSLSHVPGIR